MTKGYHHLPKECTKEWFIHQYTDLGKSQNQIAEELGVRSSTVCKKFGKYGIRADATRTRRIKSSPGRARLRDKEWLESQYIGALRSTFDIAQELKVNAETVRRWIKHHGIPIRSKSEVGLIRPPFSDEHKKRISDSLKITYKDPELRKHISERMTGEKNPRYGKHVSPEQRARMSAMMIGNKYRLGIPHTPETRAKISAANIGNTHRLGIPHTEDTKRKLSDCMRGDKNPFYGKHHTPEIAARLASQHLRENLSEETLKKMSESHKGYHPTAETRAKLSKAKMGVNSPRYGKHNSPETRAKISKGNKGKTISLETRLKLSLSNRGEGNPRYGKVASHGRGDWFTYPNGTKKWMRSSYEIRVASILTSLNLTWVYEPKVFPLNGTGHTYRPDFYLPDYNLWWEIKGYMRPDAKERLTKFFELYPNEDLRILRKTDIEMLELVVSDGVDADILAFGNRDVEG